MNDAGIIYMTFGEMSALAASESLISIRKQGIDLPAISVGTIKVPGTTFVEWVLQRPYNEQKVIRRQRFQAGKVKPFLHKFSPWAYTLYLDADTEIMGDITPGFEFLKKYDLCVANDNRRPLKDFYKFTKVAIEWDEYRRERDFTIEFLGKSKYNCINSGVIFWRNSPDAIHFFQTWYDEWLRFGLWDEQMAFLRAEHSCPNTKILHLDPIWNEQNAKKPKLIWHKWGYARDYHKLPEKKE